MSTTASHRRALLRGATIAAAVSMSLGLAACDRNDNRTAGQKLDSAIAKTEQAAQDAKVRTQEAAHDAKVAVQDAARDARVDADQAAREARATSAEVGQDARERAHVVGENVRADTQEVKANAKAAVEDAGITARVNAGLAKDPALSALRIDVDTHAGVVTLTGPIRNAQARERATQIAQGVGGVHQVINNLNITPGA